MENRKLNAEQIAELRAFIEEKGVSFFDLQLELTDHFASAMEARWKKTPEKDFEVLMREIYREYGDHRFRKLIRQKMRSLMRRSGRMAWSFFRSFFSWPKLLLSVLLILVMHQLIEGFSLGMTVLKWYAGLLLLATLAWGGYLFLARSPKKFFTAYYQTLLLLLTGINLVAVVLTQLPRWLNIADSPLVGWQVWAVAVFIVISFIFYTGFFFYSRGRLLRELEEAFPQYVR